MSSKTVNLFVQLDADINDWDGSIKKLRVKSATSSRPRNATYPYIKLEIEIPASAFEPLAEVLVRIDPRDIQVDGIQIKKKRGQ